MPSTFGAHLTTTAVATNIPTHATSPLTSRNLLSISICFRSFTVGNFRPRCASTTSLLISTPVGFSAAINSHSAPIPSRGLYSRTFLPRLAASKRTCALYASYSLMKAGFVGSGPMAKRAFHFCFRWLGQCQSLNCLFFLSNPACSFSFSTPPPGISTITFCPNKDGVR